MGDTDGPIRQPELAGECPAAAALREEYYRPLVRLAALLTGDADAAEAVACDALTALRPGSLIAPDPSAAMLRFLQAQVLVRSRRARGRREAMTGARRARGGAQASVLAGRPRSGVPTRPGETDFANLPVVRALQDLPRRGREAVVLTHYLDLTEQEAAHVAGVTPAALRRLVSQAMRALDDRPSGA
jgi:DNA-directed RNA polymerase specialized sigma24 family protein